MYILFGVSRDTESSPIMGHASPRTGEMYALNVLREKNLLLRGTNLASNISRSLVTILCKLVTINKFLQFATSIV